MAAQSMARLWAGYTGNIRMGTAVLRIAARKFVKLTKNF